MRRFLLGALLILVSTITFAADAPPGVHAGAWAGAAAAARATAGASVKTAQTTAQQAALVSTQTVTVAAPAASSGGGSAGGKTTTVRMVPDPYAPTMNATAPCRISVSGGVTVIGFGVSGGGSVEDDPCNLRETARLLDGIGQREAAARVMCNDARAAEALGAIVCPSIGGQQFSAVATPYQNQGVTVPVSSGQAICDQADRFEDRVLAVRNRCPGW